MVQIFINLKIDEKDKILGKIYIKKYKFLLLVLKNEKVDDLICMEISNIDKLNYRIGEENKKYLKKDFLEKLIKLSNGFIEKYLDFINNEISNERSNQIEAYISKGTFYLKKHLKILEID